MQTINFMFVIKIRFTPESAQSKYTIKISECVRWADKYCLRALDVSTYRPPRVVCTRLSKLGSFRERQHPPKAGQLLGLAEREGTELCPYPDLLSMT